MATFFEEDAGNKTEEGNVKCSSVGVKSEGVVETSSLPVNMEDDTSNIVCKMEEESFTVASKVEDGDNNVSCKTEDETANISSKIEVEPSNIDCNMEDEHTDTTSQMEEEPADISTKIEASNIDCKMEDASIAPCIPKKEPGFKVANSKFKLNPDEIDFMLDLNDSEPSDIEFSDDSSSDIDNVMGDKADMFSDDELEVVDSLPKTTVNEVDESKIEKTLAERVLPARLHFRAPVASLGRVLSIPNPYSIIIQANQREPKKTYQILDEDTILVYRDRQVIGTIFETFGPVSRPLYLVRFPKPTITKKEPPSEDVNSENAPVVAQPPPEAPEMPSSKFRVGQEIWYAQEAARVVPVNELFKKKGTDASNQNDEEIESEEMEFSDDEKELKFKAKQKAKARKNNNRKISDAPPKPPKTTAAHKKKRNKLTKVIDEDNPSNNKSSAHQDTENADFQDPVCDYTRLLRAYDDL